MACDYKLLYYDTLPKIRLELGIHYLWRLALSPSSDKDRDQSNDVSSKKYTSSYPFFYILIEMSAGNLNGGF